MNEVSIIINGKRYDSVRLEEYKGRELCEECCFFVSCENMSLINFCTYNLDVMCVFKESTKPFEP